MLLGSLENFAVVSIGHCMSMDHFLTIILMVIVILLISCLLSFAALSGWYCWSRLCNSWLSVFSWISLGKMQKWTVLGSWLIISELLALLFLLLTSQACHVDCEPAIAVTVLKAASHCSYTIFVFNSCHIWHIMTIFKWWVWFDFLRLFRLLLFISSNVSTLSAMPFAWAKPRQQGRTTWPGQGNHFLKFSFYIHSCF